MRNLLLSLALLLPFPVLAAGVEITTPRIGPAPHPLVGSAIASNGRSFLTVWNAPIGGGTTLYASASGSDGRPTTAESVHVANLPLLALLSLGDDYGIFARDGDGTAMLRVSKDGHLQSRIRLPFNLLDVAWNGQRFLGVERATPASKTTATLFDLDGRVIVRTDLTASLIISVDVTAVGSEFVVLASDAGGGVTARRVSNNGSILSSTLVASGSKLTSAVRAVARGADVLAVWARSGQMETVILRGGSVIHPSPIATFAVTTLPVAVATAGGYAVLWNETDHFEMIRLTANGERIDQLALGLNRGRILDGAAAGDLVEVILSAEAIPLVAAWFRVDDATPVLTTASIANLRSKQTGPAVANDGQQFLAAWIDTMGSDQAAMVAHFARKSPPMDGPGIRLGATTDESLFQPARTAVAFGAGRYLVVWPDGKQLNGSFVPAGAGAPEPAFVIRNKDVRDPSVVWNGSEFFVVWTEGRVLGSRVSAAGTVSDPQKLSPDLPEHPNGMTDSQPDVAWNGAVYLATWLVAPNAGVICTCGPPPPSEVRAGRVNAAGERLDNSATIVSSGASPRSVHVASSGDTFLLTIDASHGLDTAISRTSLGDTRVLLSPTFFHWPAGSSERPVSDVVFDGPTYLLAWHYGDGTQAWLATAHRLPSGDPSTTFLRRVDDAEETLEFRSDSVAVAAGALGAAVVSSEGPPGEPARLKAFFEPDIPFTTGAPPSPPQGVSATNTYGRLDVAWLPVQEAAGYSLEVFSTTAGTWLPSQLTQETHLTLSGVGASYSAVRVSAYNGNGVSAPSDSSSIVSRTPRRRSARY